MDVVQAMSDCGIIYYTDNKICKTLVYEMAQRFIQESGLPIVSCSLKPIDFGKNIVLEGLKRSYMTMVLQIIAALEDSTTKYVFFCEHDVLYHESHFDFTPPTDDIYYYNVHNWRWLYPQDYLITYNELTSLSGMCCNRRLALRHYQYRLNHIEEFELYKILGREPKWARKLGYEPGTKKRRRGGMTDEDHIKVRSEFPNIDIRHSKTFSAPKVHQEDFNNPPTDWRRAGMDEIPGWNLRELFSL